MSKPGPQPFPWPVGPDGRPIPPDLIEAAKAELDARLGSIKDRTTKAKLRSSLRDVCELLPDEPETLAYFLWMGEQVCGPYSIFQIKVMLANFTIDPHMSYSVAGEEWRPLRELGLADEVLALRAVMFHS